MDGVLPPGLTRGNRLGEPFDSERVYVEERDPNLLREVGVPLTADAYTLLDHCDKARTGNQNSRTEAVEITAQWQGKERLPTALRTLLAQLPEHYEFENTEVATAWVPSSDEIEEQVAAIPGSFQDQ